MASPKTPHNRQPESLAQVIDSNVLLLVSLLPLLVPFGLSRNISLQALVVVLTGILAWLSVGLRRGYAVFRVPFKIVLGLYLLSCLMNIAVYHSQNDVLGSPLMRLGSLELIACVGIGLCLHAIDRKRLLTWLYASLSVLGLISVPYSLLKAHHLVRVGGLLHQPDFLAMCLAVGLLLGQELWQTASRRTRWLLAAMQAFLVVALFLTQTRAAIFLLFIVVVLRFWFLPIGIKRKLLSTALVMVCLLIGLAAVQHATDGRLTDKSFASESTSYRLALQKYGVRALIHKPLAGYGAGNVKQALACPTLHDPALQHTCHTGYYFDSSHNIYLDRALGIGWIGGISFTLLVGSLLWSGFTQKPGQIFVFGGLLIALYYLTNVSGLELEMLLWIMLAQCLLPLDKQRAIIAL